MSIRVSSAGSYEAFSQDAKRLQRLAYEAQAEIRTGQRILTPSDDPEGIGVVLQNQSMKRMITDWERNRSFAEGMIDSTHRILSDYYENIHVAAQTATATFTAKSAEDLKLIAVQINGLIERGFDILQTKHPLGEYLLGGDQVDSVPFEATRDASGQVVSVQYMGASTNRNITISFNQQISPQLNAQESAQFADYMNHLVVLRDTLNNADYNGITSTWQLMEQDESGILNAISGLGVIATTIESFSDINTLLYYNSDQEISQKVDSDITESTARLMRYQTALEAALRSASMTMKTNIFQFF